LLRSKTTMTMTLNQILRRKQMRMMAQVDTLIPTHIARYVQRDVCEGIRIAIDNRRSIYQ
jgi:hypothetical protein